MLLNYGIEGVDYIITEDGLLDRPEGWDPSKDGLDSNFWAGRMDEFEPRRTTDHPDIEQIYADLTAQSNEYPYETLIIDKDPIESDLAAMAAVLSEYIPQLQYGKFDDPAAAVAEMRQKLNDAGYETVRANVQEQLDAWATERGLK
jgi:DNA polymerase IIIc chi subunit